MAKNKFPGGFGGGMGNMNNMIRQAQKMQADMERMQEEMEQKLFDITAGGGAIKISINGKKELKEIKINPEVVDPDDVEMLEDLILAAVNEAIRTVEESSSEQMGKITGGMNIPGLF